jgi:acetyl esterase/lipase
VKNKSKMPSSAGRLRIAAVALMAWAVTVHAAEEPRAFKDVVYATVGGKPLALDLYMPGNVEHPPLVIWVHGGAWTNGNKSQYPTFLVERGFAVASLDFRSTNEARFPANVHDIKAGVRFLRAKAEEYGYRSARIAIAGASSGGHLAALVGTTNGNKDLEGNEGDHLDVSSNVQAIVSYFGASDLTTILAQSTPDGLAVRAPALQRLFGSPPDKAPTLAALASPVFQVDPTDPPLYLLHGDNDLQMPVNQALELQSVYQDAGLTVQLMILHGVGHQGEPFFEGKPVENVVRFLKRVIL